MAPIWWWNYAKATSPGISYQTSLDRWDTEKVKVQRWCNNHVDNIVYGNMKYDYNNNRNNYNNSNNNRNNNRNKNNNDNNKINTKTNNNNSNNNYSARITTLETTH